MMLDAFFKKHSRFCSNGDFLNSISAEINVLNYSSSKKNMKLNIDGN